LPSSLFSIDRVGNAPPEPLPAADRPLAGVKVLDLTRIMGGPVAPLMPPKRQTIIAADKPQVRIRNMVPPTFNRLGEATL
jgi:hypothetical protein